MDFKKVLLLLVVSVFFNNVFAQGDDGIVDKELCLAALIEAKNCTNDHKTFGGLYDCYLGLDEEVEQWCGTESEMAKKWRASLDKIRELRGETDADLE